MTSLSTTKVVPAALVNVTLTTADPAVSSATKSDLTMALEFDGTVYSVVTSVVVKLTLSFIYICHYPNPNQVNRSWSSFCCVTCRV